MLANSGMYLFSSPPLFSRIVTPTFAAVVLGFLPISGRAQVSLWEAPAPRSSTITARAGAIPERRSAVVSGRSMRDFSKIPAQSALAIPLVGGRTASGNVTFKYADASGDETIAGVLPDSSLSGFSIRKQGSKVIGEIRQFSTRKAYKIEGWTFGEIEITEVPLDDVLCVGYPLRAALAGPPAVAAAPTAKAPPIFESNPEAPFVLMIDFDGATIVDPGWEGGRTLVAAPANMNEEQMRQAWAAVADDFRFLNINVTTSEKVFQDTPPSKRVRCVVTPSNFAPGTGGIALSGTFGSVNNARSDVSAVCWSFNNTNPKDVADTISHEVGHTLDLAHDGRRNSDGTTRDEYFGGHNDWSPIMGVGYGVNLTQWSKGEYQDANNTQDDLAVMAKKVNIGFAADDASNAIEGADNIDAPTGTVVQTGIISSSSDVDVYRLPLDGGTVNVTASPAAGFSPNLKLQLVLLSEKGNELAVSDNTTAGLSATIRKPDLAKGKYYLLVRGSGYADPLTNGYSSYGSIGSYAISGTIPGKSFPTGNLQPDLVVGKGASAIGEGLFGALKQEYRLEFGKKKKIKLKGTIGNIGLMEETFKLKTFGSFSGHKYTISIKGEDVTKALKKGGYKTRVLKPGQKLRLDMVFVPKRSLRKAKTLFISATAMGDKERTDRIGITLVPANP